MFGTSAIPKCKVCRAGGEQWWSPRGRSFINNGIYSFVLPFWCSCRSLPHTRVDVIFAERAAFDAFRCCACSLVSGFSMPRCLVCVWVQRRSTTTSPWKYVRQVVLFWRLNDNEGRTDESPVFMFVCFFFSTNATFHLAFCINDSAIKHWTPITEMLRSSTKKTNMGKSGGPLLSPKFPRIVFRLGL